MFTVQLWLLQPPTLTCPLPPCLCRNLHSNAHTPPLVSEITYTHIPTAALASAGTSTHMPTYPLASECTSTHMTTTTQASEETCTHMLIDLLLPLQATWLLTCTHCHTLPYVVPCTPMPNGPLCSLQAYAFTCPNPPSLFGRKLTSLAHCQSDLCRHLRSQDHGSFPDFLEPALICILPTSILPGYHLYMTTVPIASGDTWAHIPTASSGFCRRSTHMPTAPLWPL